MNNNLGAKLRKSTKGRRAKSIEVQLPHFGLKRMSLPNGGSVVRSRKVQKAIDAYQLREAMKGWKEGVEESKKEIEREKEAK